MLCIGKAQVVGVGDQADDAVASEHRAARRAAAHPGKLDAQVVAAVAHAGDRATARGHATLLLLAEQPGLLAHGNTRFSRQRRCHQFVAGGPQHTQQRQVLPTGIEPVDQLGLAHCWRTAVAGAKAELNATDRGTTQRRVGGRTRGHHVAFGGDKYLARRGTDDQAEAMLLQIDRADTDHVRQQALAQLGAGQKAGRTGRWGCRRRADHTCHADHADPAGR